MYEYYVLWCYVQNGTLLFQQIVGNVSQLDYLRGFDVQVHNEKSARNNIDIAAEDKPEPLFPASRRFNHQLLPRTQSSEWFWVACSKIFSWTLQEP